MIKVLKFVDKLIVPMSKIGVTCLDDFIEYMFVTESTKDFKVHIVKIDFFIALKDLNNNIAFNALELLLYMDSIRYNVTIDIFLQELINHNISECNYKFIYNGFNNYKNNMLKLSSFVLLGYRNESSFEIVLGEL